MKNATEEAPAKSRNYTFRRICYNAMVAIEATAAVNGATEDTSSSTPTGTGVCVTSILNQRNTLEIPKMSALIMARNLNDFFFKGRYHSAGLDIGWSNFKLQGWEPHEGAELLPDVLTRLHRIAAHIVDTEIEVFRNAETFRISRPLLQVARDFVVECRKQGRAEWTGYSTRYAEHFNQWSGFCGVDKIPLD